MPEIAAIQSYLQEHELDGWLLADFHARNHIATRILEINAMLTRRAFYLIPAEGEPVALLHNIEKSKFTHLPGKKIGFSNYKMLEQELKRLMVSGQRIAMEYSHYNRLPYIGLVDAGTIELVRDCGVEIVTSADLVAAFNAKLSPEGIASHRIAARNLIEIKDAAFAFIAEALDRSHQITELDVCNFILDKFTQYDMETDHGPICAVDGHAGDPHYEPLPGKSSQIKKGQLILIDQWAKLKKPGAIFGDITWMGFAGTKAEIPPKYVEMFSVLARARDAAISYLRSTIDSQPVRGAEVDDVVRKVITDAGYGDHFIHRTGHSVTDDVHGTGPNIDNLETEDSRHLHKGFLFTIEPGLYFPDFGFRTEINVLIGHDGVEVTTLPLQSEIMPLF